MPPGILEHLRVSLSFDLQAAQVALDQLFLPGFVRHVSQPTYDDAHFHVLQTSPQVLVIDSITPLLAPLLSAVSAQGHAQMTDLMRHLRLLSQTKGMTVLVCSS